MAVKSLQVVRPALRYHHLHPSLGYALESSPLAHEAHQRSGIKIKRVSTHNASRWYSCACSTDATSIQSTPSLPSSHPIDTTTPLANSVPKYHSHILLYTGKGDWKSKIDFEGDGYGTVVSTLRKAIRKKEATRLQSTPGAGPQDERKVVLGLCSFEPPTEGASGSETNGTAIVYPSGDILPFPLPPQRTLLSRILPGSSDADARFQDSISNLADQALSVPSPPTLSHTNARGVTLLLCSHNTRDIRCGILGPYLKTRIEQILASDPMLRERYVLVDSPQAVPDRAAAPSDRPQEQRDLRIPVSIGLISHIGGHKWAGNLIVYFHDNKPSYTPSAEDTDAESESGTGRAVKGIWYGRVDGENIEKIMRKTLGCESTEAETKTDGNRNAPGNEIVAREFCRHVLY